MENPSAETKRRKKEILQKIRKGQSKSKIKEWLKEQYDLSDRQAYKLIHDALCDLQEASTRINISDIKSEYIERIESLYEDAVKANDLKTALKCQDMLNKLYQLYVEKQEIDVSVKNLEFKFGDE